jgi:hypothetical protein
LWRWRLLHLYSPLLSYRLRQGTQALVVVYLFSLAQARFTESDKRRLEAVRRLVGDANAARVIFGIAHTGAIGPGKEKDDPTRCKELGDTLAQQFSPHCRWVDLDDSIDYMPMLLQPLAEVAKARYDRPLEIQQELVQDGKRWKKTGIGRTMHQNESKMDRVFDTFRSWMQLFV